MHARLAFATGNGGKLAPSLANVTRRHLLYHTIATPVPALLDPLFTIDLDPLSPASLTTSIGRLLSLPFPFLAHAQLALNRLHQLLSLLCGPTPIARRPTSPTHSCINHVDSKRQTP